MNGVVSVQCKRALGIGAPFPTHRESTSSATTAATTQPTRDTFTRGGTPPGGYLGGPHFERREVSVQEGTTVIIPPDDEVLRQVGRATGDVLGDEAEPGIIDVLVWNLHKGNSTAWRNELETLTAGAELILNQEAAFYPESRAYFEESGLGWDMAVSWINPDSFGPTGVITGSTARPVFVGYLRSPDREPVFKSPKMTVATKYRITGSDKPLLVVNTHAINFVDNGAYERQIETIERAIADHDGPVLWAGDLNTWSGERQKVIEAAAARLGLEQVRLTGKDPWLDRAFVRGMTVESAVGIGDVRNSDHPAVRLRLQVGTERSKLATLHALLTARATDANGRRLHALLSEATAEELNRLLELGDTRALVAKLGDYSSRIEHALIRLLSLERLADIDLEGRARIIDALQRGHTSGSEERTIGHIIVGTRGADLTTLKNLINTGTDKYDLEQLVFHDIDDDDVRERILDHLEREGALSPRRRRLVSDIDDTVFCLLKDERVPKHSVYPGVRQFHREMDPGVAGDPDRGDRVFLTASPQVIETRRHGTLSDIGIPARAILSGSLVALRSPEAQAKKKLENFAKLKALYPEYKFCFVGDSGGADVFVVREMARRHGSPMDNLLIHDIGNLTEAEKEELRALGVGLFSTYVGAAALAFQRGLISKEAAWRVAEAAPADLASIAFETEEQRQQMQQLVARDIELLRRLTESTR